MLRQLIKEGMTAEDILFRVTEGFFDRYVKTRRLYRNISVRVQKSVWKKHLFQ